MSYEKLKRRLDKKQEVVSNVRSDMRRLANLYTRFKCYKGENRLPSDKGNSGDMFHRGNLEDLKSSIEDYTDTQQEKQKAGLKAALHYLIKGSADKCIEFYLGMDDDVQTEHIKIFMILLELRKHEIFADATYDLNKRRNEKNRKPAELPNEEDV